MKIDVYAVKNLYQIGYMNHDRCMDHDFTLLKNL